MASYPNSIFAVTTHNQGDTIQAVDVNNPENEINAIETGLLSGFQHNLKWATDNTYDIGVSGANRPRNEYLAGFLYASNGITSGLKGLTAGTTFGTNTTAWRQNQLTDDQWLTANAVYTSLTNANRDSTSIASLAFTEELSGPYFRWLYTAAGANPITWTELMRLAQAAGGGVLTFAGSNPILAPVTDAVGQLGQVGSRWNQALFSNFLAIGTSPAGNGLIRLSYNAGGVKANDSAGTNTRRLVDLAPIGTVLNIEVIGDLGNVDGIVLGIQSPPTTQTYGFPYMPSMAGTPTGTPNAITGFAPYVWDDTDKQFDIYSPGAAAWQKFATAPVSTIATASAKISEGSSTGTLLLQTATVTVSIGANSSGTAVITWPTTFSTASSYFAIWAMNSESFVADIVGGNGAPTQAATTLSVPVFNSGSNTVTIRVNAFGIGT